MGGVLQQGRLIQSLGQCRNRGLKPVAERACQSRSSESGRCTGRRCIIIMMPWNVSPDTVMHSASAPCAPRCAAAGAQCQRRAARQAERALVRALRRRSAPLGLALCWLCGPLSLQSPASESAGGLQRPPAEPSSSAAAVLAMARGGQAHGLCRPPLLTSLEEGGVDS
jgi:hypothetical protein